jgi:hypothetical protein
MTKVPDKYLELNSVFQQVKQALSRLGIRHLDVEGILTGDSVSFLNLIRLIFFSPVRADLASSLQVQYGLSPALSDYKLTETVFRILRNDFATPPKLSIEQFLNGGSFTVKKIELLTDLANHVLKRSGCLGKPPRETPVPGQAVVVEEDRPVPHPMLTKDKSMDDLHASVVRLVTGVDQLETKLCRCIENLEARLQIVEGRLRIWDKLAPSFRGE